MAPRVEETLVVVRRPEAYSFCASMIMRVLSVGVAVEGGTPMRARKDCGAEDMVREVRGVELGVGVGKTRDGWMGVGVGVGEGG